MANRSEFTVGGALRRTFRLLRRQPSTVFGLSAIFYALPSAAFGLLPKFIAIPNAASIQAAAAAGREQPSFAPVVAYGLAAFAVQVTLALLCPLSIAAVAGADFRGRPTSFSRAAGAALRALPAAAGAAALIGLGVFVGALLLVVPGVMLAVRWGVAFPALAVERAGPLAALGRSRDLTRGHRWGVFGFTLVVALIALAIALAGLGGAALVGLGIGASAAPTALLLGSLVVNTAFTAVSGASSAALYLALREAKEGAFSADTVEAFA